MRIYTVCFGEDIGDIAEHFVLCRKDIPQLVIDHYWGTSSKPEPGRLTVTYDTTRNIVILHDSLHEEDYEYNVIYLYQKSS